MDEPPFDYLTAERWSALGDCPVLVIDAGRTDPPDRRYDAVIVGIDHDGRLPAVDIARFDLLLTTASSADAPWVTVPADRWDAALASIVSAVTSTPLAATLLCRLLRMAEHLPLEDALTLESLAYSTLLGGSEFAAWLARREAVQATMAGAVTMDRDGDQMRVTLASPTSRNAMTAAMRDTLFEALANALDDPTAPIVHMAAEGPCFSTGGDLGEFGSAQDLALAHHIRTQRSIARLVWALGDRASVHFHGACIGSGLECFAGAARRTASADAWFQLPELSMGLIPGAGGTVTVARAIGRHRAAWMMLSGQRVRAAQALDWGLVQAIVP